MSQAQTSPAPDRFEEAQKRYLDAMRRVAPFIKERRDIPTPPSDNWVNGESDSEKMPFRLTINA
jgi:hypothetical protein